MSNFFTHKMRGKSPGEIVGIVIFGILGITALITLCGYVIMWLWNGLMPEIFGLTTLTFWQAIGMFALAKILLGGGFGGKSSSSNNKSKSCKNKEVKRDFSKWKHYDEFWEEQGNKAYEDFLKSKEEE